MEELPLLYQQSPGLQQINLEFSEIEDLAPILPLLAQFSDLRELLLFGNRLENLPEDLSGLGSLEKMDISNNLIDDITMILPSLKSLPLLNELHITLQTENDEEMLIRSLKKLVNLNGVAVVREKYIEDQEAEFVESPQGEEEENSGKYSEKSERFSEKSEKFSEKSEKYSEKSEKYSKKSEKYSEKKQESSREYRKETESMDISDSEEDARKTLMACETSGYFGEESVLSQKYLEKIAILYDDIRGHWQKEDQEIDKHLAEDFDKNIKNIMQELSEVLKSTESEQLITVHSIKAKFKLACICRAGATRLVSKKHAEIGKSLQTIDQTIDSLFAELFSTTPQTPQKSGNETAQLEKELKLNKQEKEKVIKRFHEDRAEMLEEIESLREENKKYLDTIIRHSKSYAESLENNRRAPDLPQGKSIDEERNYSNYPSSQKATGKLLTLRQLKEVIEEIYISKAKYDERCADGKMPRETMEQHMYNYLNTKYGLKTLILDWAASIITSVKKHAGKDNDVAVFGKIIRNECDEEFRFVQIQVKETVAELLKMHLKNKFPLKNNADLMDMANEKTNGHLYEEEWNEIVKYMYNEEDSSVLVEEIWMIIRKKQYLQVAPAPKARVSREEAVALREKEKLLKSRILYLDFLKVLLDFQLKGHEKFLAKFVQIFRKVDSDADGILSEEEFRELIIVMDLGFSEEDVVRLLQIIDPYDNQQITFSEGVALFSTELIPVEGVAVMKKLSLEA